jgi:transcriptional regulator with XRE-family HTH domain
MKYHPVDVHVGKRLRQRRALLGMSQTALGKAVGLTFQQVQKYERGGNRLGASRLFEFARVLSVPVDYFFEDISAVDGRMPTRRKGQGIEYGPPEGDSDPMAKRETLELVRAYFKIRNPAVRRSVAQLVKKLGGPKR